ncbi:MAG: class I SAM-dependent methyltransferase [Firmicutes bacterium]|nr:class I SAM-dependent methyltransferase [Bacillota bacterium]
MKENIWEQRYKELKNLWGIEPEWTLIQYESLVKKGKILDLGIGEGRNVLKFALKNYDIEGVDISQTALKRCEQLLKNVDCNYNLHCSNLLDFTLDLNKYSLIISTWTLNFLKKSEGLKLINNMKNILTKGGILYLGVFSKEDPKYTFLKENNNEIEKDTFYINKRDSYITYYNKEEILNLFNNDYEIICLKESYSLDIGHGDKHYHGDIEIMIRKSS